MSKPLYDLAEYRGAFRSWLESEKETLAPYLGSCNDAAIELSLPRGQELQKLLYDAQWLRYGWPLELGGLGGSMTLRGILYDELAAAGYSIPETLDIIEIIASMLVKYAPDIAKKDLPLALSGKHAWCQGFSEPGAGSDLANLKTKAREDGVGFIINGQKTWTSHGHLSQRCGLLARTGDADTAHHGLTMFWVDLSSPGVTIRPIKAAHGHNEFCEIFYDDVYVPKETLIGEVSQGWEVAMYLLQFERGLYAWMRQAWLHTRLENAIAQSGNPARLETASEIGAAYLKLAALRAKSRQTVISLSQGIRQGPNISIDKILLGMSEQLVSNSARNLLGGDFLMGEDASAFRADWFWGRASTIFGGAAEIQRDIVSEHILGLPKGRSFGD